MLGVIYLYTYSCKIRKKQKKNIVNDKRSRKTHTHVLHVTFRDGNREKFKKIKQEKKPEENVVRMDRE